LEGLFTHGCTVAARGNVQDKCRDGSVCVSSQPAACIFHLGADVACPAGAYTERSVFFSDIKDSRSCTACSCGLPTGISCATRISVFGPPPGNCSGEPLRTFDTDDSCADLRSIGAQEDGFQFVAGEPAGEGSCAPSGTESGEVTTENPFTACCIAASAHCASSR
jgi:hypothetical protein